MGERRKSRLQAHEHGITMPPEYFYDTIRPQLCSLLNENLLQDASITLRASSVNMSSFVLSLVSPILRKMVCGNFKESVCKRINLDDVEDDRFLKLVRLACGDNGLVAENVDEMLYIGALAERLQMDAVTEQVEDVLLKQLEKGTCVELFQGSEANGLERLWTGCYEMLRDEFQAVFQHEGFERLSEETMGKLLEEDELGADREEDIFEVLVRWMKKRGEGCQGGKLLKKIRFGSINDEYLVNAMSSALPGHEMLKKLVGEALAKKQARAVAEEWDGVERLCGKWTVSRIWKERVIGANIFNDPSFVATDSQGRLLVVDSKLHQVTVFDRGGSVVQCIGSRGKAAGEFNRPSGVAVDEQGHIVVADQENHRIQVLNADGSAARCFGTEGSAVGQLRFPDGVAIDREGHIVVAEHGNHRIQVFDAHGTVVRRFGVKGVAVGQLLSPSGVAVDGLGRIVVTDRGNHRVQVFNSDGSVALCFGSHGDGPGQVKSPYGVAVDKEGRYVVSDTGNNRVQVYNSDGSVARIISAAESGVGRLSHPRGVAVSGTGRIVVVEGYDGCGCNRSRIRIL